MLQAIYQKNEGSMVGIHPNCGIRKNAKGFWDQLYHSHPAILLRCLVSNPFLWGRGATLDVGLVVLSDFAGFSKFQYLQIPSDSFSLRPPLFQLLSFFSIICGHANY